MLPTDLNREQLLAIDQALPSVLPLQKRSATLDPDLISFNWPTDSKFPGAAVCLADVGNTLCEVRYAFCQYHVHRVYYRDTVVPASLFDAVFYEKYYLDDVAFRLYGAAEDIAEAIICMLELDEKAVKRYRGEGVSSKQATLGRYLIAELPAHVLTAHVRRLAELRAWKTTRNYRDECVHEQPPSVEGQGIVYRRGSRWKKSGTGMTVTIGAGDQPTLTTEAILDFVMPAFEGLLALFEACLSWYEQALQEPVVAFPEIAASETPPEWLRPAVEQKD